MGTYTKKLMDVTFSVHHNPNCHNPFQVRLVGNARAGIDHLPYAKTVDVLGFGKSLEEAAKAAWMKKFGTKQGS